MQSVLSGKNLDVVRYAQTLLPNLFICAMLVGTIDLYHFLWSLPWPGVTESVENILGWLLFLDFSTDQDEI